LKLETVIDELINVALSVGGTLSGEHGVGFTKKNYLNLQVGEIQINLMKAIKHAFDPHNILNPMKVLDL
jgi:glycolate oxidase